jgi:hypothetical protein
MKSTCANLTGILTSRSPPKRRSASDPFCDSSQRSATPAGMSIYVIVMSMVEMAENWDRKDFRTIVGPIIMVESIPKPPKAGRREAIIALVDWNLLASSISRKPWPLSAEGLEDIIDLGLWNFTRRLQPGIKFVGTKIHSQKTNGSR